MFLNDPRHHDIPVIYHTKGIPFSKGCPEYRITTKEWKELSFPLYKALQVDRASRYWYIEKLKKDGQPIPPDLLEKHMHDLKDMRKEGISPPPEWHNDPAWEADPFPSPSVILRNIKGDIILSHDEKQSSDPPSPDIVNAFTDPASHLETSDGPSAPQSKDSQTPHWSILSELISYKNFPLADFTVNPDLSEQQQTSNPTCLDQSDTLEQSFFSPYDGVQSELQTTTTCNDETDVRTTFIGTVSSTDQVTFQKEYTVPFDAKCVANALLPTGDKFKLLFDTGATRSYLSADFYNSNDYLKKLSKFEPHGDQVYMGSGDWVKAQFIIPVVIYINDCAFEVYALICKMTTSDFI